MSHFTIKTFSDQLYRPIEFEVMMPDVHTIELPWAQKRETDRPDKTIFLFHGFSGNAGLFIPEYLIEKHNIAVVMPSVENSFYLDAEATGRKFCTFVGEELPAFMRRTFGLCSSKDDTYVLGLSMGGFGALHTGLRYPDTFGKIGAMSSALIHHEVAGMKEGTGNAVANYAYYREVFGEPSKLLGSENDPEELVKRLINDGRELPEIFMACGTEDFLLEENRAFHRFLENGGVQHTYVEDEGNHDPRFWSKYSEIIIDKFME